MDGWQESDGLCALGQYRQALAKASGFHKAEILYWMGDLAAARLLLKDDFTQQAAVLDARCCWQADLYQDGLDRLEPLEDGPDRRLIKLLIQLCQGTEILESYQDSVTHLQGHRLFRAFQDLAVCFQFRSETDLAACYYSKALQGWLSLDARHPEAATALFGLSGVLETIPQRAADFGAAVEHFLQITSPQDQRREQMVEALLASDLEHDNLVRAEWLLQDLDQLRPDPKHRLLLGKNRFLQGKYEHGLAPIEAALQEYQKLGKSAECADCWWMLARLQFCLGRPGWDESFQQAYQLSQPGSEMRLQVIKDWSKAGGKIPE